MAQIELSVVVPVYNEVGNLETLYQDIVEVLEAVGRSYEVLFIDDGSTDDSLKILQGFQMGDPCVRVIEFRKNFGQTAAIAAGLRYSDGVVVITLEAYRQNDPLARLSHLS